MAEIPTTTSRRSMLAGGFSLGVAVIPTQIRAEVSDPDEVLKHRCAEHRDAMRRYREESDRSREADELFQRLRPAIPSALFWREEDTAFGLSQPGAIREGRRYFTQRDLAEIEKLDGFLVVFDASHDAGALAITSRRIPLPDGWREQRDTLVSEIPSYEAADAAAMVASGAEDERLWPILDEVEGLTQALAEVPAKTGAGLAEKARCALSLLAIRADLDGEGEGFALWRSVVEDAAAIGGGIDLARVSA